MSEHAVNNLPVLLASWMQAQEQQTQAEVNEIQARFSYIRAKAQIEALVGRAL